MLNIKKIGSIVVEQNTSVFVGENTNKMQISQCFYLKDRFDSISKYKHIFSTKTLNTGVFWFS